MKSRISEAVILMAGSGSRLRGADETFLKPLVPILGRPLVSYTIDALTRGGVEKISAVVGFESDRLSAVLKDLIPRGIELEVVENREWQKQNGISLLATKNHVVAPFLLTMSDHLFDAAIVDLLIRSADTNFLNVAIDRKLDSIFDLADAMKLQTRQDRVVAIGKNLEQYDAIDIGLFVCPLEIFDYLERAKRNDDCSLADGVRAMAADGKVRGIDIGDAWWQDIDTPEMLAEAERHLRESRATMSAGAQA
jgi:choline kinase